MRSLTYPKTWILGMALAIATTAVSCKGEEPKDNKAKMAELLKEQARINSEIAKLKKESGADTVVASGTPTVGLSEPMVQVFRHFLEVQGSVQSDQNIFVTPKVPGAMVTQVTVTRGQRVSKGDVIARLDATTLPSQMEEMQNQLELTKTLYEKQKSLWDEKIGTEIAYIQAKNNYESMKKRMSTLNNTLALYTLRSPIDGVVDEITLRPGEIAVGMTGIRIVNGSNMRIVAEISENYVRDIKVGDMAKLDFPVLGKTVDATVKRVSNVINATNRTFLAEFSAPGLNDLSPNMIVVARINDYTNKKAMVLPVNAIQNTEAGTMVFIAEGKVAKKRMVKVGSTYGEQAEILSGLNPGDKVITEGYQNIADGVAINY